MQCLKTITTAIFIMAATTANAQNFLFKHTALNHLTSIPAVLTVDIKSAESYVFTYHSIRFYSGSSQSAPCSDLHLWAQDSNWGTLEEETEALYSDDIVYNFGERATCIKEEITWREKTYSTGNIQLLWDEATSAYTAATPDKITLDFNPSDAPTELSNG